MSEFYPNSFVRGSEDQLVSSHLIILSFTFDTSLTDSGDNISPSPRKG